MICNKSGYPDTYKDMCRCSELDALRQEVSRLRSAIDALGRKPTQHLCECGTAMIPTGTTLLSNPPQYPHVCPSCKKRQNLKKVYSTNGEVYVQPL